MKLLALLTITILVSSCGKQVKTQYMENPYDNSANDAKLVELESKIADLESKLVANDETITNLNTAIAELDANQEELIVLIEALQLENDSIIQQLNDLKKK